jgi:hypothetical protein
VPDKPLGRKSYGHIAHLPGSRIGPGDHKCHEGQRRIACEKSRDRHDRIIVTEKLDGSNVGVALLGDRILPLTRAGYYFTDSNREMHHRFGSWVLRQEPRFRSVLKEGERFCGEWLEQAHGTLYNLPHEPFVVFDLMTEGKRASWDQLVDRAEGAHLVRPQVLSAGSPCSIAKALDVLGTLGHHGATEQVEGAVWRVERRGEFDFMAKFVRPDKEDGKYLKGESVINSWR